VLAVPESESADTADDSLTFALLWLTGVRHSRRAGKPAGLRLILRKGTGRNVAHCLAALNPRLPVELYEHDPSMNVVEKIDPRRAVNLDSWLVPHRESEALLHRARPELEIIAAAAPEAITLHPTTQAREVWLRFRGLPFARWEEGQVFLDGTTHRKSSRPLLAPS
jgi:hypothetical protein